MKHIACHLRFPLFNITVFWPQLSWVGALNAALDSVEFGSSSSAGSLPPKACPAHNELASHPGYPPATCPGFLEQDPPIAP